MRAGPAPALLLEQDVRGEQQSRRQQVRMTQALTHVSTPVLIAAGIVGAVALIWALYADLSKGRTPPRPRPMLMAEEPTPSKPTPAAPVAPAPAEDPLHAVVVAAVARAPDDPNRVVTLLAAADRDLQAMRMVASSGDQAIGRYQEVLRLDPGNAAARQGVGVVAEKYAQVAQSAIGQLTRMAVEGGVRGTPDRPDHGGDAATVAAMRTELEAKTREAEQERTRADLLERQLQEVKGQMVRLAALEEKLQAWETDKRRIAELEKQVAAAQTQQVRIQELETRLESARAALERVNELEKRLRLVQQERSNQERQERAKKGSTTATAARSSTTGVAKASATDAIAGSPPVARNAKPTAEGVPAAARPVSDMPMIAALAGKIFPSSAAASPPAGKVTAGSPTGSDAPLPADAAEVAALSMPRIPVEGSAGAVSSVGPASPPAPGLVRPPAPADTATTGGTVFVVQLAAHRTEEKAREMEGMLRQRVGEAAGLTFSRQTAEVGGATWYRVRTNPFANREGAEQALQAIRERTGLAGMVLRQGSW
ncbi:MAG: SPOR domain-containing protein [Magnetococcales bacterium]|nr:SPOR domain-containing protein [Magnetococcales bacterium]